MADVATGNNLACLERWDGVRSVLRRAKVVSKTYRSVGKINRGGCIAEAKDKRQGG